MPDSAARPPEPPEETIRRLLACRHPDLYVRDQQFRADIDSLAGMLPAMVDGLAAWAECAEEDRQRTVERPTAGGVIHFPTR